MRRRVGIVVLMAGFGITMATGAPTRTVRSNGGSVESTMVVMRLAGTLLQEYAHEFGTYPSADGEIRPLVAVLTTDRQSGSHRVALEDAWGRPLLYRASACCYQLVSLGADGRPELDYKTLPLFPSDRAEIIEAIDANGDLVLVNGHFVRRPFGPARAAIKTINSMNVIAMAMMCYAIDNNRYAGTSTSFALVSELAADLVPFYVPELPTRDGWGHPILYFSTGATFGLASFGPDGKPDRTYYTDLASGIPWNDEGPSADAGADVVFANGRFVNWPTGVEP